MLYPLEHILIEGSINKTLGVGALAEGQMLVLTTEPVIFVANMDTMPETIEGREEVIITEVNAETLESVRAIKDL